MSMRERIEARLVEALRPERMRLANESHKHSVPKGAETHWNLVIVSEAFEGKSPVARHRAVYGALDEELKSGIHALTLKALTPKEWEDLGGEVTNPAPPCLGGSKRTVQ